MKKRILMLLIATMLLLSSCSKTALTFLSDSSDHVSDASDYMVSSAVSDDSTEMISSATADTTADTSSKKATSSSRSSGKTAKTASAADQVNSVINTPTVVEEVKKKVSAPAPAPTTVTLIPVQSAHTALSKASYYGYVQLSIAEKALYDAMNTSVLNLQNVVDISELHHSYSISTIQKVFSYFISDCPQYFWIYKYNFLYSIDSSGNIMQIILFYTDGKVADSYNINTGEWETTVSRTTIIKQRNAFDKMVSTVLKGISPAITPFEKEKQIHDFVVSHVTYDYTLLNRINENPISSEWLSDSAFTAYGAMVNGLAVCEGYSKLFQVLCYEVGIPAIPVIGKSQDQNHMWNAAQIEGDWYQVDTTWDDSVSIEEERILFYDYFNLTTAEISADHSIAITGDAYLIYTPPTCVAVKYNYRENYYIQLSAEGVLSQNAKTLLLKAVSNGESYLTIRLQTAEKASDNLNKAKTKLNNMLASSGVKATLTNIFISENYGFIRISRK